MAAHRPGDIGRFAAGLALALLALSGCSAAGARQAETGDASGSGGADIFAGDTIAPLVAGVPERTVAALPAARLAVGLIPPTNRWFSGLVFGEVSMPVFPLPLSFQLTAGGFAFGVPTVTTGPKAIMGGFTGAITADVGARRQVVTGYDEASVTITQRDDDGEIGRTVIAEGSPFVSFTATRDVDVRLATAMTATGEAAGGEDAAGGGGPWTVEVAGTRYGLAGAGTLDERGTTLALRAGQTATWYAIAEGGSPGRFAEAARHPLVGTSLAYTITADRATTSLRYRTTDGGPTLIAAMPHQSDRAAGTECSLGSYPSVYGELRLCAGTALAWSVPRLDAAGSLDLAGLDAAAKERLAAQVGADVDGTGAFPEDTYFGGKALYRAANLLKVAEQVGADRAAATIRKRLVDELGRWFEPTGCSDRSTRCFVYDPAARGLVGLAASFGSDSFNDHHFHYGYFLYAAGVAAADDPALAARWAPVLNLLAADLATSGPSDVFPQRRVFDAYAGHSWASGTAPFADGNNQESSSEAVTAWNGLALWAAASGQAELRTEAAWLLSAEAASALAYWTDFPRDDPVYSGFEHPVSSLVWGGKRDYATWFSPEPSAMLGILVLPMSPVAGYLGGNPDRVRANLADAAPNGFDVLFGDYLLMYSALAGPDAAAAALSAVAALPADRIDDGNSRAYLLAWLYCRR
ncbi:glycosyl hydrolase [Cryobacterium sp. HLT2-28]|uniref:glycosyl hydrolase n=1 Tax=Cryobacterium sp. HLT2-28 TaxID=1259146 RepID=UPI00106CCCEF|nr:glycosyl hydrolase [Cryobacterium sp. HLT2-28]TFB94591.1 1,3-beta-glucanase [Cryobacterium sp. HLT2-28]